MKFNFQWPREYLLSLSLHRSIAFKQNSLYEIAKNYVYWWKSSFNMDRSIGDLRYDFLNFNNVKN